jgi:hypothetical protein
LSSIERAARLQTSLLKQPLHSEVLVIIGGYLTIYMFSYLS